MLPWKQNCKSCHTIEWQSKRQGVLIKFCCCQVTEGKQKLSTKLLRGRVFRVCKLSLLTWQLPEHDSKENSRVELHLLEKDMARTLQLLENYSYMHLAFLLMI